MAFMPSPKQKTLFDWVEAGRGNAVVIAVAGSGKSTSIVRCTEFIPPQKSTLILAFNAPVAGEMSLKLTAFGTEIGRDMRNTQAKTFHSLGLGMLRKRISNMQKPDSKKCRTLFKNMVGEEEFGDYSAFVCKLVGLAKGEGVGVLSPDLPEAWFKLIEHHDLELDSQGASVTQAVVHARALLARSNTVGLEGIIDFDDMLYLPLLWKLKPWQNDWVFIDEAQDTNPVRRALAKLALKPGGRLVAVGDPRQAIYGFTGASHDAIDLIKREFNACELPLTVSYRCPRAVAALAKEIVPYFEPYHGADEGEVNYAPLFEGVKMLTARDVILCRNVAPLVALAYYLISKKTGATILGRDIGEGLISLVRKMKAQGIPRLVEKLGQFRDREVSAAMAKGEETKAEAIMDRCDCIHTIIDALDENKRTIGDLVAEIEGLFGDNAGNKLQLCTIHKAKGKEWPTVAIYRDDLMPSKYARQEWQALQEENLRYVAYTRAQQSLIFLDGDLKSAKKEAA